MNEKDGVSFLDQVKIKIGLNIMKKKYRELFQIIDEIVILN